MENVDKFLPVFSLVIAALAVFVGPMVSSRMANRQLEATIALSRKNIVSPIRQNWINELRKILSELTTTCACFWTETNEEEREKYHLKVRSLIGHLELYINPKEAEHKDLLQNVVRMERSMFGKDQPEQISDFWSAHRATVEQSQKVLKIEWERVKNEI